MHITPDAILLFHYGFIKINATIFFTWVVMFFLTLVSWLITRKIPQGKAISTFEVVLETIVNFVVQNLQDTGLYQTRKYLGFIGTLFLFISVSGLLAVIPGYVPPTGSLSTTAGLALCVFVAVPIYAIGEKGVAHYLKNYLHPSFLMLPFNIMGDLTRTLALAVRLFGNTMSGTMVAGIMISVAPFVFPVLFDLLGLLTTLIQAYIFSILATVYIAAATRSFEEAKPLEKK